MLRRCRWHTRASIGQAIVRVWGRARGKMNCVIRYFIPPKCLSPFFQRCPDYNTSALDHPSRHLPPITRRRNSMLDLQASTPQHNPPSWNRTPLMVVRGYSTTRNARRGRRQYVYVDLGIPAPTLGPSLTLMNPTSVQVGINYTGRSRELKGCVNDARNVRKFLMSRLYVPSAHRHQPIHPTGNWGFGSENIIVLTDDARDPKNLPTKANILGAMKWLVKDAKADDSLFFHCKNYTYPPSHSAYIFLDSGHGGQTLDKDGDEVDGYDEGE